MNQPTKTSIAAILSIVFGVFCFPIGLILGIVAMVKINNSDGAVGGKGLAIAGIVISCAMVLPVACGGFFIAPALLARASMEQFQCRSMQSEAKAGLRGLFVAQESYRAEEDKYGKTLEEINFTPFGSRYVFVINSATETDFLATATGTDSDVTGDVWTLSNDGQPKNVNNACPR